MDVTLARLYFSRLIPNSLLALLAGLVLTAIAFLVIDTAELASGARGAAFVAQLLSQLASGLTIGGGVGLVLGTSGRIFTEFSASASVPVGTDPQERRAAIERLKQARRAERHDDPRT